jgi:hypothetical protein
MEKVMAVERRIKEASALRVFFHEQWQHLTEILGVDEKELQDEAAYGLPVGEAIDEIVQGTDARVRAVYNYKDCLRTGTRGLLEHIDGIVDQISGAVMLSRKSFIYDHQVSSLLGSMKEVQRLCEESDEIQEYLNSIHPPAQESFYALLFMNYHEKIVFGDELRGDVIQRDVKQTSVYFSGHRFLAPAADELDVRLALKHILFENVVQYLKLSLNREKLAEKKSPEDYSYFSNSMETLNNPSRYLNKLVHILEMPLELISLHEDAVCVNSMGIKISDSANSEEEIHLQELEIGGSHSYLMALVEMPFNELEK